MKEKIGIGLVTYNSPERIEQSAFTVPSNVDSFVIVNDGTPYTPNCYPKNAQVITHSKNLSVGCAKNTALRQLLQNDCTHLFIMEDDILIKNQNIFDAYLNAAHISGLWHLSYGYHGPANLDQNKTPKPRQIIDYGCGVQIALNAHSVGAFCYYHKGIIRNVGYMDERFKNAWEHVEHSYRIVKTGLLPAYWWWPDIANSMEYLQEIGSSEEQSVIRKTDEWKKNLQIGAHLFKHLHGYSPVEVPDTPVEKIKENLKFIKETYSREV
jgi:GT2 family glycosyltransferase